MKIEEIITIRISNRSKIHVNVTNRKILKSVINVKESLEIDRLIITDVFLMIGKSANCVVNRIQKHILKNISVILN
jgi:hypothetical protein